MKITLDVIFVVFYLFLFTFPLITASGVPTHSFFYHLPEGNPEGHKISFRIDDPIPVKLYVYNFKGDRVETLIDEVLPAGEYDPVFRGTGLPGGIYFYRLHIANLTYSGKILLVK